MACAVLRCHTPPCLDRLPPANLDQPGKGLPVPEEEDAPAPLGQVGHLSEWDLDWVDQQSQGIDTQPQLLQSQPGNWRRTDKDPLAGKTAPLKEQWEEVKLA